MSNILNMLQNLFRYAFFIILIIILLMVGLLFFYFNNQIMFQNTKIDAMGSIISDIVHNNISNNNVVIPMEIPLFSNTNDKQDDNIKCIEGKCDIKFGEIGCDVSQLNLIQVSDSEDDSSDDESDDDESDNGDDESETFKMMSNVIELGCISNCEHSEEIHLNSDDKPYEEINKQEEIQQEPEIDIVNIHKSTNDYKSMQVSELRKIASQLNNADQKEVKKMKKDELIDLLSRH
jgi:hypothetical protein